MRPWSPQLPAQVGLYAAVAVVRGANANVLTSGGLLGPTHGGLLGRRQMFVARPRSRL
jgi:hypothetical protein